MRVNELVAAPPPRRPRRCCHCTHAGPRREGGRRRARYVYDTKGERGTMTITVLVDWRAMNNLGTMCAAAAATACRAGQWGGKSREERREKEREGRRGSRLLQTKLQILGKCPAAGCEWTWTPAGRGGRTSLSRTRLFACRHRCVCVLFHGPGKWGTEGGGKGAGDTGSGQAGGESAASHVPRAARSTVISIKYSPLFPRGWTAR